jgi:SAM-dependent methyltransferase
MIAEVLPGRLARFDLGDDVLEIGPGFGATTQVLLDVVPKLTVLEIDHASAELLRGKFGDRAEVVEGSGAQMPFGTGHFSAVVCFTMLHHLPTAALQDAIFGEAAPRRHLLRHGQPAQFPLPAAAPGRHDERPRPGHPAATPRTAGFEQVDVRHKPKEQLEFSAVKPA